MLSQCLKDWKDSKPVKPKLKDVKSVQKTSTKLKCKVCECQFTDKDVSKEHWSLTKISCKTCQQSCVGAYAESGNIFPDNPEHVGQERNIIKNKYEECIFIFNST